jgi:hypothetical protein
MRTGILVSVTICVLCAPLGSAPRQVAGSESSSCAVIEQALNDFQHIKVGTSRREVEKYFRRDGGMQFPGSTRYVYPKCDYIKLEVDFSTGTSVDNLFGPNDTVTKVSEKLFLNYLARD